MNNRTIIFWLLILTTAFWNSWVFGWLNHGISGYSQMSISELNIAGQPFYHFFAFTELISGILLLLAGAAMLIYKNINIFFLIASFLIAIMGILTIYDAVTPLDCNQYQNKVCTQKVNNDSVSVTDKDHNIESTITDYVSGVFAAACVIFFYRIKANKYYLISSIAVLLIVLTSSSLLGSNVSEVTNANAERIWNLFVSVDFVLLGFYILRLKDIKGHKASSVNHI